MPSEAPDADYLAARDAAQVDRDFEGHDALDPTKPSGHAYGIKVSTRLTSDYRHTPSTALIIGGNGLLAAT